MGNSTVDQSTSRPECVDIKEGSKFSDLLMGIYIVTFIFGFIFNVIVFAPIVQQIRRKNVLGIYLIHLSVSDLLYIFTMPLWILYYNQDHHWKLPTWTCDLSGFFYYSNMYISIYLLCLISIDRCLTISFPFQAKALRRSRYAWVGCMVIFLVISTLHGGVLFLDKEEVYDNKTRQCYETYPINDRIALFNLLRFGLGFILPCIMLVASYKRIWAEVRSSTGLDDRSKLKVKRLAMAVICIFCICFLPYHLLLALRSIVYYCFYPDKDNRYCKFEQNLHFFFSTTLALSSFNCVVDPILYMLASNGVREDMRVCYRRRVVQSQPVITASTRV